MEAEREEASTLGKGHGRVEHRRLITTTILNEHLDWPGMKQACKIIRTTTHKGETKTDVAYGISSVGRDRADAKQLLQWNRGHWGIENRLHWVRDESFGEDHCRVRTKSAPQILAGIRNIAINWLRSQGIDTIAEALRENGWNPQRFFTKLGKPNS
jgi:predicted transposase YbfD/YdcC